MPLHHPKLLHARLDQRFLIKQSSPALEAFLGLDSTTLSSKTLLSFLSDINTPEVINHLQQNLAQALSWQGELNFVAHNGQELWAEVYLDKSGDSILLNALETTEQRKIQKRMQENLRFQEALMQEAPVGIMVASDKGECEYLNSKWLQITGLTRLKALGKGWLSAVHPDDRQMVQEHWQAVVQGASDSQEYRYLHPDGKVTYVYARSTIIEGKQILRIENDLTEIKQHQKLLEEQQHQIRENARLASLGTLASALAHEINNPLTIVSCYVDEIEDAVELDEQNKKILDKIRNNLGRIEQIARSTKTLSENPTTDGREQIDLEHVRQNIFDIIQKSYLEHDIKLIWPQQDLPLVEGHYGELLQVLTNIFTNAAHAMNHSIRKEVLVQINVEEKDIQISIEDSGSGIEEHIVPKIFDPFFTTKDPGKGTGLGLSISKKFMRSMGGDLWLESPSPTIFTLSLALSRNKASA